MIKEEVFYDFGSKMVASTVHAHAIGLKTDENGTNDRMKLIEGNYAGINFPVTFKQEYGKKWADILDTGWPSLYLISDRVKRILEENKLTRRQTFSIKLYDKKDNEILGYHGFSVTGKSAQKDYSKSVIIEKQYAQNAPICKFYKGFHIDLESWDKMDFFIPETTIHIIITKKTAEILKKNKITNLCIESIDEYETDVRYVKIDEL